MAQNGLKLNSNTKKKANKQVEMFIFIKLNLFRKTTKKQWATCGQLNLLISRVFFYAKSCRLRIIILQKTNNHIIKLCLFGFCCLIHSFF